MKGKVTMTNKQHQSRAAKAVQELHELCSDLPVREFKTLSVSKEMERALERAAEVRAYPSRFV